MGFPSDTPGLDAAWWLAEPSASDEPITSVPNDATKATNPAPLPSTRRHVRFLPVMVSPAP